jgi:hypothetical protein
VLSGDQHEAAPSAGGLVGLSILGCAFALGGLVVTSIATDSGWSDAIWADRQWSWLAWSVTCIGCVAAGYALLEALKLEHRRRRVFVALGVEVLAAVAWIALGFAATAT